MMSDGVDIRPIAIIARCRMPPENSCGYCLTRTLGVGQLDGAETIDRLGERVALRAQVLVLGGHLGELACPCAWSG